MKTIYLDYAATTPVDPRVIEKMLTCLGPEAAFGNPASDTHSYGLEAKALVEKARQQVAAAINAQALEIVWTSGATEADNLAIKGIAGFHHHKGRHIITVQTEHKAVIDSCRVLQAQGCQITYLQVDVQGAVNLAELSAAIRDDTILISIMLVNNETGYIQDIAAISAIAKKHDIYVHVDAAQALGKLQIDVEAMNVDLMSLSAHKVYGPKGIGALYVRRTPRVKLSAQMHGGGHELGMRSGTLATHQIVAMGEACALAQAELKQDQQDAKNLRRVLLAGLNKIENVVINSDLEHSVPNIVSVSFVGIDAETLLAEVEGLAIAKGSACNSVSIEPSYVLLAMGIPKDIAQSALRISFGRFTTESDIEQALLIITKALERLRPVSKLDKNGLLSMTPTAVKHIEAYLQKHQAKAMRLTVKKSGCSGYKYDVGATQVINDDDKVFIEKNAVVVISKEDLLYYAGTELDYVQDGLNKKLVFNNPLAQNVCGCGESFNLKK